MIFAYDTDNVVRELKAGGNMNLRILRPTTVSELSYAMYTVENIKSLLNGSNVALRTESAEYYEEALKEQEGYINEYLSGIKPFNNSQLVKNIEYLCEKNHVLKGMLEGALGLSAGYISRTAKENSGKRMSIDAAVMISKFFNVDIGSLLFTDLSMDSEPVALAKGYIHKLTEETEKGEICWLTGFPNMDMMCEEDEEEYKNVFPSDNMIVPSCASNEAYPVAGEMVHAMIPGWRYFATLVIVPYLKSKNTEQLSEIKGPENTRFSFLFMENNEENDHDESIIQYAFSTDTNGTDDINDAARRLYNLARNGNFYLPDSARNFIKDYISRKN